MFKDLPFDQNVELYEAWFEEHPQVYETELAAIKKIWPKGEHLISLEIAAATGRFSKALGISEAVEPSAAMASKAEARGIQVLPGVAEDLPYDNQQFDIVLMNFCISYLEDPRKSIKEAFRVLKQNGFLIIGFIERNSRIGEYYQQRRRTSIFYEQARFYRVGEIERWVIEAGFEELSFSQTLFRDLYDTTSIEDSIPGVGKGSYILIKAIKKVHEQV